MEEDYKKYMEGDYEGNFVKQYMQIEDDKKRAEQIAKEVKAVQEAALESEKKRLSDEYEVTGEELDALMKSYNQEDKFKEYLVDGAILRCNQATTDDFPFSEEETVVLANKNEECCNITLNVSENPISVNELRYATVKDTLINVNIIPPKCNCRLAIDRNAERRRIREDTKRNENGVCMHLMRLNEEWDNLEIDGKSYLKEFNIEPSKFSAGVGNILGKFPEEVDGITMTSVLFCKHGGLITPVTSGQEVTDNLILGVSDDLINLLKKYETGMDTSGNILPEGSPALSPYHSPSDDTDVYTIGWGHAMHSSQEGKFLFSDGTNMNLYDMCIYDSSGTEYISKISSITYDQAEEILQSDIEEREEKLNEVLEGKQIVSLINQRFYDALFSLIYQVGVEELTDDTDLSRFLNKTKFDPTNAQEIKEQFGEYTNHTEQGTMRRRADELDIIFYGTYERDYDETRYGDIWAKKTHPNQVTQGY